MFASGAESIKVMVMHAKAGSLRGSCRSEGPGTSCSGSYDVSSLLTAVGGFAVSCGISLERTPPSS